MTAHHDNQPDGDLGYLLTAYADGQLAPEGVAWVEAQLAQRPELRERLDEIRALQTQLRAQLQHLPIPSELDATRRERLLAVAGGPRPALRMPSRRWHLAAAAALLVCTVGVVFMSVSNQRPRIVETLGRPASADASESHGLAKAKTGDIFYEVDGVKPSPPVAYAAAAPAAPLDASEPTPVLAFKEQRQKRAGDPGEGGRDKDRDFGGVIVAGKTASATAPAAERNLSTVDSLARGRGLDGREDASRADRKAPSAGFPGPMLTTPAPTAAPAAPPPGGPAPVIAKLEPQAKSRNLAAAGGEGRKQADAPGAARPLAAAKPGMAPPPPSVQAPMEAIEGQQTQAAQLGAPPPQSARAPVVELQEQRAQEGLTDATPRQAAAQNGLALEAPANGSTGAFMAVGAGGGVPAQGRTEADNKKGASLRADRNANEAEAIDSEFAKIAEKSQKDGSVRAENFVGSLDSQLGDAPAKIASQERERLAGAAPPRGVNGEETKKTESAAHFYVATDEQKALADDAAQQPGKPSSALAAPRPDPRVAAAALVQPVAFHAGGDLDGLLHLVAGDRVGVAASQTAQPALSGAATLVTNHLPRGQALIELARGADLQARLIGGTLQLDAARAPLDPTDLQGLDRATFKQAFATQPMIATAEDAQSTFALDADTASYERARAQLRAGQAVDPAAIQPEHFINAMPMDYPPAQGPEAFTLYAEAAPSPFAAVAPQAWSATNAERAVDAAARPVSSWSARTALVAVGAVARPAGADERRPLHLTLAIDCSGSMAQPGGLERIQVGLLTLIAHLRAEDRVGIVAFGDQARVVLPATPGSERERLAAAVKALSAGGSTNCAEGLALAYQLAAETVQPGSESRVVLATDGGTLAGASAPAVVERVAGYRQRGITLLILGCGATAYQSETLEELANKGDGQHLFLGSDDEARGVFSSRLLPERLSVLAKDAKVQVTWNAQRVSHFRLIGYEKRRLAHQDFRNDAVDAGEISHDTQVTALYEVLLVDGASGPLGSAAVRYFDTRLQQVRELTCPLPGSVLAPQPSQRLRLLACAAELAEFLQRGWWSNVHASSAARILAELKRCDLPAARELEELTQRAAAIGRAR